MNEKQELIMSLFKESLLGYNEERGLAINIEEVHLILSFFLSPIQTGTIQAAQLADVIKSIEQFPTEETTVFVLRSIEKEITKELGGTITGKITSRGNQKRIMGFIIRAKDLVEKMQERMIESYSSSTIPS